MTTQISAERLRPHVGEQVTVVGTWSVALDGEQPANTADTEVTEPVVLEVVRLNEYDHGGPFEQFSLDLRGPRSQPLEQGTYVLAPGSLPLETMFICPRNEREDVRVYEAMFSVPRAIEGSTP